MYTEETDEYKDKNWQQFSKVSRMLKSASK